MSTETAVLAGGCFWPAQELLRHRDGVISEIFYTSDEQRQVAEDTIADADASGLWPGKVVTKISEASLFWEAEAEDQSYLQHYPEGSNQFSPKPSAAG